MFKYETNYIEPAVSYFDGPLDDAGKTCITGITAVAVGLLAILATSARGSQSTLDR